MELKALKGIDTKRENDFKKLGILNTDMLIRHFPRNYLDLTKLVRLSQCQHNQFALILCKIVTEPQVRAAGSRKNYVKVLCESAGEAFSAIWFNQPYVKTYLKAGKEYFFYGRVQNRFGAQGMTNPIFEPAEENNRLKGLVPVYKITGNLTQKTVNKLIVSAISKNPPQSAVPYSIQKKYALEELAKSYHGVHSPEDETQLKRSSSRIAVEEYFLLISAFKFLKGGKDSVRTNTYTAQKEDLSAFISKLPYKLTDGQKGALKDIYTDLKSPLKMNRLLQGDVGSGKTAVALCAVFMAQKSGFQSAFAAPTEILARQNYEILKKYFGEERTGFLSGSMTSAQKRAVKQRVKNNEIDILCGTHAIMEPDVEFYNLALCVCDEQHRFGVRQRSSLTDKGASDVLVMSATPIPRTLSLIIYGDLDISEIKDKPMGRGDVKTVIVSPHKKSDMYAYIKTELKKGRQAYIVCPRIEDDEEGTSISAKETFDEVSAEFKGVPCALLHGKMKESEKQQIMDNYRNGKILCLVSTTVIEVGIDVKNAVLMVIMGADRFGLSQLHQLRGRIGRGELDGYCFCLVSESTGEDAINRLKIFKSTNDGFVLASHDYEMRGGGDFLGTRQSGRFFGEIKNLKYNAEDIMLAKKLSEETFDSFEDISALRAASMKKYAQLKDIVLN